MTVLEIFYWKVFFFYFNFRNSFHWMALVILLLVHFWKTFTHIKFHLGSSHELTFLFYAITFWTLFPSCYKFCFNFYGFFLSLIGCHFSNFFLFWLVSSFSQLGVVLRTHWRGRCPFLWTNLQSFAFFTPWLVWRFCQLDHSFVPFIFHSVQLAVRVCRHVLLLSKLFPTLVQVFTSFFYRLSLTWFVL